MRPIPRCLALTALCLVLGCAGSTDDGPSGPGINSAAGGRDLDIGVMTRNLYVGADADAVIAALASPDVADDIPALVTAVETLRRTDYARRAAAFADEIARHRPHAVGLQEVSTIDLTLPPLNLDVHLAFLPVLLGALADRGLTYDVAARVRNFEVAPLPGVRLADDDVLLV